MRVSLPGAASTTVRDLLTRPAQPATVLGGGRHGVYLQVGASVLAVETADAVGLPCAVRLGEDSAAGSLPAVRRGARASVGGGALVAGDLRVQVVRWWRPRTPRPALTWRRDGLAAALRSHPAAVPVGGSSGSLLGLGPGSTPAGDDVLAGMLVALHHDPPARDALAAQVLPLADGRTTALSATLLRSAAHGHGIPALLDVVDLAAGHGDAADLPAAVARLRGVGHTSGTALAWGLLRGLDLLAGAATARVA